MIWWHRCSTHGKREGKAAGGRVAAVHVGCVVVCVVCVVYCVLCFVVVFCVLHHCYHTGSKTILAKFSQNGPLLRTHITKSAPKDNKY
jgi:hypothetical protein